MKYFRNPFSNSLYASFWSRMQCFLNSNWEQVKSRPDDAGAGNIWYIAVFENLWEIIAGRIKDTLSVLGNKRRC